LNDWQIKLQSFCPFCSSGRGKNTLNLWVHGALCIFNGMVESANTMAKLTLCYLRPVRHDGLHGFALS
jgi:hypothetical protein